MKELAHVTARQAQYRLEPLAKDIKAAYQQAHLHALETCKYALICGRKLAEAKRYVRHGEFERYMVESLEIHPTTGRRYMELADYWEQIEEHEGLDGAARMSFTEGLAYIKRNFKKNQTKSDPLKVANRAGKLDSTISGEGGEDAQPAGRNETDGDRGQAAGDCGPESAEVADCDHLASDGPADPDGGGGSGAIKDESRPDQDRLSQRIDSAFGVLTRLLDEYHLAKPHELLWAESGKGLDQAFAAFMTWRKL